VTTLLVAILVVVALPLFGWVGRAIFGNPRGDFESGFAFLAGRVYVGAMHALRIRGRKRIPGAGGCGPLIVACNHTAGVDPILVQAACPFFIRWVMAQDMREARLEWFWRWWEVIFVDRATRDSSGMRVALRHLASGGVIGIFPEGALERPPRQVLPFMPGIGMLVRKSGARVLTVTIEGTPQVDPAWSSLWRASRSVVHFREVVDYADSPLSSAEIAEDLRRRFLNYTGWAANEHAPALEPEAGSGKMGRPVTAA